MRKIKPDNLKSSRAEIVGKNGPQYHGSNKKQRENNSTKGKGSARLVGRRILHGSKTNSSKSKRRNPAYPGTFQGGPKVLPVHEDDHTIASDEVVTKSLVDEKQRGNRKKYSISPPFLENTGLSLNQEANAGITEEDQGIYDEDFENLSSDKEEDTTEGEISDTHTSE